ncbi:MAG: orotidine-5'-phosphate decarboxylase [Clostridiales Family XIII bacterium]|jgi:orotidine-5'-phosphate decarboxylase|nr:orotidine-5'-phosphate decarboxylase [Clostridiales Family XIII bacterium]
MIDRLIRRIDELGCPVVVGLDPTVEMIPEKWLSDAAKSFGETTEAAAFALFKFNREIIDAVADVAAAVKPNIAMYERFGLDGIRAYIMTIEYAMGRGLMIIGDVKRGDIASTAEAYAAHIEPVPLFGRKFEIWNEDAVTLNPYLGADSVQPFLNVLKERDKGVFLLVKTSNAGSADVQDLFVETGGSGAAVPLYEHVAGLVSEWGRAFIGECGYSKVGAVVGATHPEVGARLRTLMPHTFFLVPGYGAQGASASDIAGFFDETGRGCIVNSSRGIIAAWKKEGKGAGHVGKAARAAVIRMRDELRGAR